jgi:hypothetical protein
MGFFAMLERKAKKIFAAGEIVREASKIHFGIHFGS